MPHASCIMHDLDIGQWQAHQFELLSKIKDIIGLHIHDMTTSADCFCCREKGDKCAPRPTPHTVSCE